MKTENTVWHEQHITKEQRASIKQQKSCLLWYTGLSGSGKSTVANAVDALLFELGCHSYLLDGDNVRHGLNGDLGFSDEDRVENIRRIGEVCKLFVDGGFLTLASFVSPYSADRDAVRELMGEGDFVEIFIDTPVEICEERDPKGLYEKARTGEISNFSGVSDPYEVPEKPEMIIKTADWTAEEAAVLIIEMLEKSGKIQAQHN